jgi:hypothetical protein
MLDICNFGCRGIFQRIGKLTVKTLLMEVFIPLTPTSCVNYKAFLESLPTEGTKTEGVLHPKPSLRLKLAGINPPSNI